MIDDFIELHRGEFVEDLSRLVTIDSSRSEAIEDMPYGRGPAQALVTALEIAEGYGLYTENWGNRAGIVQLEKTEESQKRRLDIFAHLDVVPGGSGWTKTDAFTLSLEEGKLYGRGTADDKGPALTAIYALRAIREMGIKLKGTVRLVLGCDEESGCSDLEYYFAKTEPAEMSFSPDSEYPLVNAEKGRYAVQISASVEPHPSGPAIIEIESGDRSNVIPDRAYAAVRGLPAAEVAASMKKGAKGSGLAMQIFDSEKGVEIVVCGEAGHASCPGEANNALTGMLQLLISLPLAEDPVYRQLGILQEVFPHQDYYGAAAGLAMEDQVTGKLTASLDVLHFGGRKLDCTVDCRIPVYPDSERFTAFEERLREKGFSVDGYPGKGHYVPEDTRLVKVLLKNYEHYTGEKGYCTASGGGTYVHGIDQGVAFGCGLPGIDNHLHGPDEFAELDVLLMSSKLFAASILELCQ